MKPIRTWKATWSLVRRGFWPSTLYAVLWWFFLASPVANGLIDRAFFDHLTGANPTSSGVWRLLALLGCVHVARVLAFYAKTYGEETFRYIAQALLRANLIRGILRRPGAQALSVSPGGRHQPLAR